MLLATFLVLYRKTLIFPCFLNNSNRMNRIILSERSIQTTLLFIDCFIKQYNGEEQQHQQQAVALTEAAATAAAAAAAAVAAAAAAAAVEEEKQLKWQETFAVLHKDVLLI